MNFWYVANLRMPTEKAHGIQIVQTCRALADAGASVTLVVARRANAIGLNVFEYFGVPENFTVVYLPVIDGASLGGFGFVLQQLSFGLSSIWYLLFHGKRSDATLTREPYIVPFLRTVRSKVVFEIHHEYNANILNIVAKCAFRVVGITQGIVDCFVRYTGYDLKKTSVVADAVSLEDFSPRPIAESKDALDVPQSRTMVLYTGSLFGWKGADVLLCASRLLPEHVWVYFVGGTSDDIAKFSLGVLETDRVVVVGKMPHSEMPLWMSAGDVLVLPNSGKYAISAKYTSPMKLFEYMAMERPIVCSDLPAIREVVTDEMVYYCISDSPESLANAIVTALTDSSENRKDKISNTLSVLGQYTWEKRARSILALYS